MLHNKIIQVVILNIVKNKLRNNKTKSCIENKLWFIFQYEEVICWSYLRLLQFVTIAMLY